MSYELPIKDEQLTTLLLQGWENPQIAKELGINLRTVKARFNRMFRRYTLPAPTINPKLFKERELMIRKSLAVCLFFASLSIVPGIAQGQNTYYMQTYFGPQFTCHGSCSTTSNSTYNIPFIGGASSSYTQCDACGGGDPFGFVKVTAQANGNSSFIDNHWPANLIQVTGDYEIDAAVFGNSNHGGYPTAQIFVDGVVQNITAVSLKSITPTDRILVNNDLNGTIQYISADGVYLTGNTIHDIGLQIIPTGGTVKGDLWVGMVTLYPHTGGTNYIQASCAYYANGAFSATTPLGQPAQTAADLITTCQNYAATNHHSGAEVFVNVTTSGPIGANGCGSPAAQCQIFNVQ